MDAREFVVKQGIEAGTVAAGMCKDNLVFNSFTSEDEETGKKDFHVLIGVNLSECPKEVAELVCLFAEALGTNPDKLSEIRDRYLDLAKPTYKILN